MFRCGRGRGTVPLKLQLSEKQASLDTAQKSDLFLVGAVVLCDVDLLMRLWYHRFLQVFNNREYPSSCASRVLTVGNDHPNNNKAQKARQVGFGTPSQPNQRFLGWKWQAQAGDQETIDHP